MSDKSEGEKLMDRAFAGVLAERARRVTFTTTTLGDVDGMPVSAISYPDGRAFVSWGTRLMPLPEVDKLIGLLREARVEAALRPALDAEKGGAK